jgi:hypothetical protein
VRDQQTGARTKQGSVYEVLEDRGGDTFIHYFVIYAISLQTFSERDAAVLFRSPNAPLFIKILRAKRSLAWNSLIAPISVAQKRRVLVWCARLREGLAKVVDS